MKIKDEVLATIEALKKAGFNPFDAVFEGALGVKEEDTLEFLQGADEAQMVSGVVRVIYSTPDGQMRFVEIPVGQPAPTAPEAAPEEEVAPPKKKR